MSAQHTPGPWQAHFGEAYFVTGPDLGRVAMMMNLKGAHGLGGRRSGDESAANCRLIASAPDHALVARALACKVARWESFGTLDERGELCFGGLRYSTRLDEFGVPKLSENTRAALMRELS